MNLQKIVSIIACMFATTCYANDLATRMSNQIQPLIDAQSALSLALGGNLEPSNAKTVPCTYKNTTAIPVVVTLSIDGVTSRQQINPGAVYTQNINPAAQVSVDAHANLSPLSMMVTPGASYALAINDQADLALTVTGPTGSAIVNNSGWHMMISYDLSNNTSNKTILTVNQTGTLPDNSINITVTPMTINTASPVAAAQSCSIQNNNGMLAIVF